MTQLQCLLSLGLLLSLSAGFGKTILPEDESFDPSVKTPEDVLGWSVGDWHVQPAQLQQVFVEMAQSSDRIVVREIGRTHEQRPLIHGMISSPENLQNLEQLRQQHLAGEGPLVVWLGYSIHGNEASGSNAAMLVAYHLAASKAPWVAELLDNTIVILDPMFNPDGLGRFATWANMHKGEHVTFDRVHRDHNEAWPRGRFNHYWFDMNRDWLPATQPESKARLQVFQQWRPHVLGDFHEQGSDSSYFFQPGIPSRTNHLTPARNQELTAQLAAFHAQALDKLGVRYYSRESFDDYYYGKGSTYPDINGSIGILFEQPSVRGHAIDTRNGPLRFVDAVQNQYATSISTLRGAWELRDELMEYQRGFQPQMQERARKSGIGAWVFGSEEEFGRTRLLANLLELHGIEISVLNEDLRVNGKTFATGKAFVVATNQPQAGLISAMFDQPREFRDNAFYDVSAWTLPMAYNLPFAAVRRAPQTTVDSAADAVSAAIAPDALFYRIRGAQIHRVAAALALAREEFQVMLVGQGQTKPGDQSTLKAGDILVRGDAARASALHAKLSVVRADMSVEVKAMRSGENTQGLDWGSPNILAIKEVKPALLVGQGVNPMEAGHIWHLIDQRLHTPLPMIDLAYQKLPPLHGFTHLLLPDVEPASIPESWIAGIKSWVESGGVLVAQKRGAKWAEVVFSTRPEDFNRDVDEPTRIREAIAQLSKPEDTSLADMGRQPYGNFRRDAADRVLGGAIFSADMDLSHPLAFGYHRNQLPVFVNSTLQLEAGDNAYSTVLQIDQTEPLAGFSSAAIAEGIKERPLLIAERQGAGAVIKFGFNPNFRGFWLGTELLYANALLNSALLQNTVLPRLP